MPNLFDALEGTVFRDESILSPEFQPDVLPGRERELKEIAFLLKPLAQEKKAPALLVYGPPGTGKTSSVKFVFRELKEYCPSVDFAYVNCWTNSTRQSVFSEVSRCLGLALPRRGLASDEVFMRLAERIRKKEGMLAIALDEADRLFFEGQEKVLYDLARETGEKVTLVFLTNEKSVFQKLDDRTKSALSVNEIEFAKYSPPELKQILAARAEKAFNPNSCPKEAVATCAAFAAKKGGDARIAIESLWLAGRNAEKRNSSVVMEEDWKKAFASQENLSASKAKRLVGLSLIEQSVLQALDGKEATSGELYSRLPDYSDRIIRSYVNLLAVKKLVELKEKDEIGKTRVITPLV